MRSTSVVFHTVRVVITIGLIVGCYFETGIWTALSFSLIAITFEFNYLKRWFKR
jgi:hypothetical protein